MNTNAIAMAAMALGALIYLAPIGVICLDPLGARWASRCDGPNATCTDQIPIYIRYLYPAAEVVVVTD